MKIKYFNLAKNVSLKSNSKFKLGCVIVNKNRVINFGFNEMTKTHPKCKTWGNYRHAELHALIGMGYEQTRGSSAYIYRETRKGELASSRPCPVCMEALKLAGIKKIFYTDASGYKEESIK